METIHNHLEDAIRALVAHLRGNPAWPDGYSHEGWVAVEAAAFFRKELGWGVARDAPYVTRAETKYSDVYARSAGPPLHVFFEFKCISAVARSWETTLKKFEADVCTKLAGCEVVSTQDHWSNPKQNQGESEKREDAWVSYLETLKDGIKHGRFVGVGVLFIAVNDERIERLRELHNQITKAATPSGPPQWLFDGRLPESDGAPPIHCLAYCVGIAENCPVR